MRIRTAAYTLLVTALMSGRAGAQNWNFDAREIGMSGVGGTANLAASMIEEERRYRSIVLPFGLIQVLRDFDTFDPRNEQFDPARAIEYAASPVHYVVGRDSDTSAQAAFINDIRNARLSRDLGKYKGFVPAGELVAEGLAPRPALAARSSCTRVTAAAFRGSISVRGHTCQCARTP